MKSTGMTKSARKTDVVRPAATTIASGRCTSAPGPVEKRSGNKPKIDTSAVMRIGRSRFVAPSITASRIPSRVTDFGSMGSLDASSMSGSPEVFAEGVLQVDDDDRSRLNGVAEKGDEADPDGDGEVHAAEEEREHAADETERDREEHHAGEPRVAVCEIQKRRHEQECERHYDKQTLRGALLVLVLTGPHISISPRQFQFLLQGFLRFLHEGADVASTNIRLYDGAENAVLALDLGGPVDGLDRRDTAQECRIAPASHE